MYNEDTAKNNKDSIQYKNAVFIIFINYFFVLMKYYLVRMVFKKSYLIFIKYVKIKKCT